MKFDLTIRNTDKMAREVSEADCIANMLKIFVDTCGEMGGRQTNHSIMYLSVPPVLERVLVC